MVFPDWRGLAASSRPGLVPSLLRWAQGPRGSDATTFLQLPPALLVPYVLLGLWPPCRVGSRFSQPQPGLAACILEGLSSWEQVATRRGRGMQQGGLPLLDSSPSHGPAASASTTSCFCPLPGWSRMGRYQLALWLMRGAGPREGRASNPQPRAQTASSNPAEGRERGFLLCPGSAVLPGCLDFQPRDHQINTPGHSRHCSWPVSKAGYRTVCVEHVTAFIKSTLCRWREGSGIVAISGWQNYRRFKILFCLLFCKFSTVNINCVIFFPKIFFFPFLNKNDCRTTISVISCKVSRKAVSARLP